MKNLSEMLFVIALVILINSCRKDEAPVNEYEVPVNEYIDKYTLEIDNNFRIYKVTLSSFDWRRNYILEYTYASESIRKTLIYSGEPGERIAIYYLNNSGLADTSLSFFNYNGESRFSGSAYYFYDTKNYLKLAITKSLNNNLDTSFFDYIKGNMIKYTYSGGIFGVIFPTASDYTYNSIKNYIDIVSFNSDFLGKLNENLVESWCYYGHPEGTKCSSYEYVLNPKGLVEERKRVKNYDQYTETWIDKFEYIIK